MTRIIPSNSEPFESLPKNHEDNKKGIKVLSGVSKFWSKAFTKKHVNVMYEGEKVTLSTRSIKRYANIENLKSEEIRRLCNLSKYMVEGQVNSENLETDIKNLMTILDKSNSSDSLKNILLSPNNESKSMIFCKELFKDSISENSLYFLLDQGAILETLKVVLPDSIKCDEDSLHNLINSNINKSEKAKILLSIKDSKVDTDRLNLILNANEKNKELFHLLINNELSTALQNQNLNDFVDFLDTLSPEVAKASTKAIETVLAKVVSDSNFSEERMEDLFMSLVKLISQNPQEVNSDTIITNRLKEIVLSENASNKLDLLSLRADKFDTLKDSLDSTQYTLQIRALPKLVEAYISANIYQKEKLDAFMDIYEKKKSSAVSEDTSLGFLEDNILNTALDDNVTVDMFQTLMTYFSTCLNEEEYSNLSILSDALKSASISKGDFDKLADFAKSVSCETLKAKVKALENGVPSDFVFQDYKHLENYLGVIYLFKTILIKKGNDIKSVDLLIQEINKSNLLNLFESLRQQLLGCDIEFLINLVDIECNNNEEKTIVEGFVETIIDPGLPEEFLSDTLDQLNEMQLTLRNKMYSNIDDDGFIINRDLERGYEKLFYSIQRARLSLGAVMFEEAPALGLKLDDSLEVGQKLYSVGGETKIKSIYKSGIDMNRTLRSENSQWGNLELGPGVYFSTEGPVYAAYDTDTGTILDYMIELEVVEKISGVSLPKHGNLKKQSKNQVTTQNRNLSEDEINKSFFEVARHEDNSYLRGQTPKGATELVLYRPSKQLKVVGMYKYTGDDSQGKAKFKKLDIKDIPSDQWYQE